MDDLLMEPLDAYNNVYKTAFAENAKEMIDELIRNSGMDVEGNKKAAKEYRHVSDRLNKQNKKISKLKGIRGLFIFLIVAAAIDLVVSIVYQVNSGVSASAGMIVNWILAPLIIVGSVLAIALWLQKKIKHASEIADKLQAKADEKLALAKSLLAPLLPLFDWGMTAKLITKTVPEWIMDKNYDMRRFAYMRDKFGFTSNLSEDESTVFLQSGEVLGNPFLLERRLVMKMGSETYSGSITIHWTTTHTDSEGHVHTDHHSQVLTATVTKPKPFYYTNTGFRYANEAAPDLSFSHKPSHAERYSGKKLERKVNSNLKKLRKKASKSIESGGNFTELGDEKFDALFSATDRDHEVQFRLLFTPLARRNMLRLMCDAENYGDDFTFYKRRCINTVYPEHMQDFDYTSSPDRYRDYYDVDMLREAFLAYNNEYFRSVYFGFAPLFAIPLYRSMKPHEYIYGEERGNYTEYEGEVLANALGEKCFRPSDAITHSILKVSLHSKEDKTDHYSVTAYAYRGEARVDFVSVWGGDGRMHSVPVHWTEYIPVARTTGMAMQAMDVTEEAYRKNDAEGEIAKAANRSFPEGTYTFQRGLFAFLENLK